MFERFEITMATGGNKLTQNSHQKTVMEEIQETTRYQKIKSGTYHKMFNASY